MIQDTHEREAFEREIATLPAGAQRTIRESAARGESLSWQMFQAGARCAALQDTRAEPVATFGGQRLTPEGTREFWGFLADGVDGSQIAPDTPLYTRAESTPPTGDERTPNPDEVICPKCTHQFRAIPENVQAERWRIQTYPSGLVDFELVDTLRSFGQAYPEDMFGPVTDAERKEHGSLITRTSAGMGRHCAKFMAQAADMIERLASKAAPMTTENDDTARLNWIERQWTEGVHVEVCGIGRGLTWHTVAKAASVFVGPQTYKGATLRDAIDSAIAASENDVHEVGAVAGQQSKGASA